MLPQLQSLDSVDFLLTKKIRLCIAGMAGAGTFGHLWDVPGISDVLVGCYMPYAKENIDDFLGFTPDGYCNEGTAMDFAMEAFYRAYQYGGAPAVGVGLSAVVASKEAHRGYHRIFVATFQEHKATLTYVKLVKGVGAERRHLDGQICNALLIGALKDVASGYSTGVNLPEGCIEDFRNGRAEGLAEERLHLRPYFSSTGKRLMELPIDDYKQRGAVYPDTYDPPHFGHFGVAKNYIDCYGGPIAFTIEGKPPHKDPIHTFKLLQRVKLLKGHNVMLTWGAPLYADKSKLFPGINLILGADVFQTVINPKWGLSQESLAEVLLHNGSTLIVADRKVNGVTHKLRDFTYSVSIPVRSLECNFDISSTDVRERKRSPTTY